MQDVYLIDASPDVGYFDVRGPGGTLLTGASRSAAADLATKLNSAFVAGYLWRIQEEERNQKTNTYYKRGSDGLIME